MSVIILIYFAVYFYYREIICKHKQSHHQQCFDFKSIISILQLYFDRFFVTFSCIKHKKISKIFIFTKSETYEMCKV